MSLPAPNLDDRRFQQLVDEAKRYVQKRCPEWSDHNVSDPGVTLIETFAFMLDQLHYRLNRVPDKVYIKFLDLLGLRLNPPTAARTDVTFWLSAQPQAAMTIPEGTEVSTQRTELTQSISFATLRPLELVPVEVSRVTTVFDNVVANDRTLSLDAGGPGFHAFDEQPKVDDQFRIALSEAAPSHVISLDLDCQIEGVGVNPDDAPIAWEAFTGEDWVACEIDQDTTGGLNRPGKVLLHVPASHEVAVLNGQRGGWLRCRLIQHHEDQTTYSRPPKITRLVARTAGGTVTVINADTITQEIVGISEGTPGQRFPLAQGPVVTTGERTTIEVSSAEGWVEWEQVDSFSDSGPDDRHFLLDAVAGEIVLGPAVREPNGAMRHYGAVPGPALPIRITRYRVGGGRKGNVARRAISVLRTTIPYVTRVENRRPALGGVDGETLDEAKARGPLLLRTRDRAVTPEDYEVLAQRAAPGGVPRVKCLPADQSDPNLRGAVQVLLVPDVQDSGEHGGVDFFSLLPNEEVLATVTADLERRQMIGARLSVEPAGYVSITVVAQLRPRAGVNAAKLEDDALRRLYTWFHPLRGGPDGRGWPFGRPVQVGEVFSVLQNVHGVEYVENVLLFLANPLDPTAKRQRVEQRVDVPLWSLVHSFDHQINVQSQ